MGTSLVVQWLKLHASNAEGTGLILEIEIPHVVWCSENKKTGLLIFLCSCVLMVYQKTKAGVGLTRQYS